jgi:hypothetical protein
VAVSDDVAVKTGEDERDSESKNGIDPGNDNELPNAWDIECSSVPEKSGV